MVFRTFPVLLSFLVFAGCSSYWQHLEVDRLSYGDLFRLTAYVIDSEGFVIDEQNADEGLITTRWDYNKLVDVGRFPIRRRVEARVDPAGDGMMAVKVRIKQEALWGSYATVDLKHQKGWEDYGYDKETARRILMRLKLMVKGFEPSKAFFDRQKKLEEKKEAVPEVLRRK